MKAILKGKNRAGYWVVAEVDGKRKLTANESAYYVFAEDFGMRDAANVPDADVAAFLRANYGKTITVHPDYFDGCE